MQTNAILRILRNEDEADQKDRVEAEEDHEGVQQNRKVERHQVGDRE